MIPAQVGELLPDQPAEPAHQRRLVLAGELGELPDDLDQRLLDHVGQLDPLAELGAQAGPDDHPQVVAIEAQSSPSASRLAGPRLGHQFDRSGCHSRAHEMTSARAEGPRPISE